MKTMKETKNQTHGDLRGIQDRFQSLWEKARLGIATPDENRWLLEIQEQYWTDSDSLGNLYDTIR